MEKPPELRDLQYVAFERETCPSTGRAHWQGFAYSTNPISHKKWREYFPHYVEKMNGSFADNEAYCSKVEKLTELGTRPMENGRKRTFRDFKEAIDEGLQPLEVAERGVAQLQTFCMYRSGLNEYFEYIRSKRIRSDRSVPEVHVLIGEPGTGKTRYLDNWFGLTGWTKVPCPSSGGQWFFTRENSLSDAILIDDVGPSKVPKIEELLEWLDRYPLQLNTKGGHTWFKPKVVVITSNLEIDDWWEKSINSKHKQAFMRRVTKIFNLKSPHYISGPFGSLI